MDILVEFDARATSRTYFGVQFYIEDLLGRRVDLVTDKALRSELRPYVEREAVDVWLRRRILTDSSRRTQPRPPDYH